MIDIPLEILNLNDGGFHILVEVVVFDKAFKAVVDTGASRTVLDKTTVEEYIDRETLLMSNKLSVGLGTTSMESYILTVPQFVIGDLTIPDYESAVLDLSSINHAYADVYSEPIIGVLGGDILMDFGGIIDYPKQLLRFSKFD